MVTYKPWDGVCGDLHYKSADGLVIDEEGTVYFTDYNGPLWVWCPASRLRIHLHRLYQVCGGELV